MPQMNKIERAIYDAKLHLKNTQLEIQLLKKREETYHEVISALEHIQEDKHTPHQVSDEKK